MSVQRSLGSFAQLTVPGAQGGGPASTGVGGPESPASEAALVAPPFVEPPAAPVAAPPLFAPPLSLPPLPVAASPPLLPPELPAVVDPPVLAPPLADASLFDGPPSFMEGEPPAPPLPVHVAVALQSGESAEQPLAPTTRIAARPIAVERSEVVWKLEEK